MKKALFLLVVLMFLFMNVSPASAVKNCDIFRGEIVDIRLIDPVLRYIQVPYKFCWDPVGGSINIYKWLAITDRSKIKFVDGGKATFDDFYVGQPVKYAFYTDELGRTIATAITIYPE